MVHWGVEEISLDNLDWNESKIGVQSRHSPPIINGSSMASSGQIHLETELHSMRSCCCASCRWFVAWRFIQESGNLFHSMRSRIELRTVYKLLCDYLDDMSLEDLFKDHVIRSITHWNHTPYHGWNRVVLTRMTICHEYRSETGKLREVCEGILESKTWCIEESLLTLILLGKYIG